MSTLTRMAPRILGWLACGALFATAVAAGEPGPAQQPEDIFAESHRRLSRMADEALARVRTRQTSILEAGPDNLPTAPATTRTNSIAEERLQSYALRYWRGRTEDLREAIKRLKAFQVLLEPILLAEEVPPELIAVVLVESAARVEAVSPRGARGLWQFMPATAERYGLRVNAWRDERLDPILSTRAAARYLRDLYRQFGAWELALAAYNAGERAVLEAMGRAGTADFWTIYEQRFLPTETQTYVPAVLAAQGLLEPLEQRPAGAQVSSQITRAGKTFAQGTLDD